MTRLTLPDFTPHAGQRNILRNKRSRNVACMGRRFGKALALDTPIPTPTGWTTMGAIKDGDIVFDELGNHCRVLHAHPVMIDRPCCVVTFSDGAQVVCDEDHLWRTWDRKARKNKARNDKRGGGQSASKAKPLVRSTAEIASSLKSGKDRNHSIECCMPLQMPDANLPIQPYTLGVWLGDGSSTSAAYYKPDAEIADYIRGEGYPVKQGNQPFEWRITDGVLNRTKNCFQATLRATGLLGNKHIPPIYLRASQAQRLALLQGLMDTDGSVTDGHCEFSSSKFEIAQSVLELLFSFGIRATCIKVTSTINGLEVGDHWRIGFSTNLPVFRLPRKRDKLTAARDGLEYRGIGHRFIESVERVASVPVRCITVDSESRLYLCAKQMIPTHNTYLMCEVIMNLPGGALAGIDGKGRKGLPTAWYAPNDSYFQKVYQGIANAYAPVIKRAVTAPRPFIEFKNGGSIDFWTLENPMKCGRGNFYARVIIDEAAHARHLQEAWEQTIEYTLADLNGDAWFISTPYGRNYFWELWQKGSPDNPERDAAWASFTAPSMENPHLTPGWMEEKRKTSPERVFAQEVLAQFLQEGAGVFRRVTDAIDKALPTDPYKARDPGDGSAFVIGVDWGRTNDFTVFTTINAKTGAVVAVDRFTEVDYATQLGRLQALHQRFPKAPILAESNSMGGPLIEQLQRLRLPVRAFHTSAASKTQAIEALALAFENGAIHLPDVKWLSDELMAFDQERLPSGTMRYGAPRGGHDDGVMSLAIAWSGLHYTTGYASAGSRTF